MKEEIIETIAHELIEAIGRDTVDRFEEDKDGNLKISLVSLECVAEKIADELFALIEQEKDDLLKEFVEWQAKQYKDLYYRYEEEIKEEKDHDDYIWLVGKKAGIGEIRQSLKTAVEKFMEDKK